MNRIKPFDSETILMAESLTGHNALITPLDDEYTMHVSYAKNREPEFVNAVINAIRGRLGERVNYVKDDPDQCLICFGVKYDDTPLPYVVGDFDDCQKRDVGLPVAGNGHLCKAIRVHRDKAGTLREFVGNGRMIIQSKKMNGGKAWFEFINNGTFMNVPEHWWIIQENGRYFSCSETWFNDNYKPLNYTFYLSLPISGHDIDERKAVCEQERKRLLAQFPTCRVIAPFDVEPLVANLCDGPQYGDYMAEDIRLLLNESDCVVFLVDPRATLSKGVRAEYALAQIYEKDIVYDYTLNV